MRTFTVQNTIKIINNTIANAKKSNINVFSTLKVAYLDMPKKEYEKVRKGINMEISTINKMETILDMESILDNMELLPAAWGTLHEIAMIRDDNVIKEAITNEVFHVRTTKKEVSQFREKLQKDNEEEQSAIANEEEQPATANYDEEQPATMEDVKILFRRKEGVVDADIAEDVVKITSVLSIHFDNVDSKKVEQLLGVK